TTSCSRPAGSRNDARRRRTSCSQSGMLVLCHPADRFDERGPCLSLLGKDTPPIRSHGVEAASALSRLLDPPPLDPPALLEPIQERVERIDVERQLAAGPRFNQLAEVVSVPRARVEQRQDQEFGGSFLQLAIQG